MHGRNLALDRLTHPRYCSTCGEVHPFYRAVGREETTAWRQRARTFLLWLVA